MKRLYINKVMKTCKECVFCERNHNYGRSYDSGYDCMSEDTSKMRIINDHEMKGVDWPFAFPDWCPLDDVPDTISECGCGCKFKNDHSNAIVLCEACSKLPCHNPNVPTKEKL